jgi:phosphate transport system substrate-binding protein
MMMPIIAVIVVIIIGVGGYFGAASVNHYWPFAKGSTQCTGVQGQLSGAGSTFVNPLMTTWSQQYNTQNCIQVNYQAVGSGTGITDLTNKLVDFGASDAPLSAAQRALLPGAAVTIPESAGAVVIIYNVPGVTATLNLSGSVIAKIYLGTITNWNDPAITALNTGVTIPSQTIAVVHRSDGSGTTFAFTSYLSAESSTWASSYGKGTTVNWPVGTGAPKSAGVSSAVSQTTGAIGYVELTYALSASPQIAFANVLNPAGTYVHADLASTAAAVSAGAGNLPSGSGDWYNVSLLNQPGSNAYPITTFTYLLVYLDVGKVYGSSLSMGTANQLVQFLWWVVHSGQSASAGLYFVALPSNVVTLDETTIGSIVYNGAALTSH